MNLFSSFDEPAIAPLVVSYGLGVDSTAALIGLRRLGIRPDAILFANTLAEKQETYDYLPIMQQWLLDVGFPPVTVVQNTVKDFKNWPPYSGLLQNCLTNGTLPSLAFGFKSCSLKWKVVPQNKWCQRWWRAQECWVTGGKVMKLIGFDASPNDRKRYAASVGQEDAKYDYWYPLIEWNWDRARCKAEIIKAGLPVPPKSACFFCPATQPEELLEFRKVYLRAIVIMEARAAPRLEKIQGLWRNGVKGNRGGKKKPGRMTDFIVEQGLLPEDEVGHLIRSAPTEILERHEAFANGFVVPEWHDFIEMFTPEDCIEEIESGRHRLPVIGQEACLL